MGCLLVVHYWADLQSVDGFVAMTTHTLHNANVYSAEREMSASDCARCMAG